MKNRFAAFVAVLTVAGAIGVSAANDPFQLFKRRLPSGAVYTMTNAAEGNKVLIFDRSHNGTLRLIDGARTGGIGTGAGLGNQGGVVLTRNEKFLLVVNAGSDSISVFAVERRGLRLSEIQPSGGPRPVSVTEHRGIVYVLNHGNDSITGFWLLRNGRLRPIPGSTRFLSGSGVDAAQVSFSPDGDFLVVTEKATNQIVTFEVDRHGVPGDAQVQASNGQTPFGFAFGKRDQLFVSEAFGGAADASAISSYDLDRDGVLMTISPSVGTTETAACWVVVTPNGRYLYTTNTGSGSISGYAIDFDGSIELLDADGRTGVTGDGSSPIDLTITDSGRFLYSLNSGNNTISGFRVGHDGSLTPVSVTELPPGANNGLASR